MKLDFKNIDEVFKDGLEDYTEQPSGKVWENISGKMFWYDLLHLRFGNIPRVWLGSVAGVLILAVLIGFWVIPGGDEIGESSGQPFAETAQNDQQITQPDNETNQPRQAVTDLEIIDQAAQTTNQQNIVEDLPDVIGNTNVQTENPIKADQPENEIITPNPAAAEPTEAVAANDTENSNQSYEKSIAKESVSTARNSKEVVKTAGAGVTATTLTNDSDAIRAVAEKPDAMQTAVGKDSETIRADNQMLSDNQPATGEAGSISDVNEMGTEEATLETLIEINKSMGAMQKMPKPGRISFHTAKPDNYGQRPAIRNYQYPQGFFNRGCKPYFSVSAYFAPEITEYHRLASESRENSWLAGVAVSYNTERYIIQTGLEYSVFDDLGDYMVNINSYDSIGFYEGVSGFEIDPENPGELIYHTHTVEVWDTVQHHSHQQTRNNYAYLQIPVMFGYKAMESGIFSAHIKAGPSFSFLLNRDEPTLNFQTGPGARISSVDNFTASRLNTNVQVLVSLALRLQFTERVGLLAEPTYRYYINSVYDINDETLKNPYGIGVRGGIFVNF